MDAKLLSEALQDISLRAGVAVDDDFTDVVPLDIIRSYALALGHGAIAGDRELLGVVNSSHDVQHFINSVSRPSVPVPSRTQIEQVRAGTLDEYKPAPQPPSKMQLAASACKRELKKRERASHRRVFESDPSEETIKEIDAMDDWRAIRRFLDKHATDINKAMDHLGVIASIERCETPEAFIKTVTTQPDHSNRPRYNLQTGERIG